jgi:hypothetical protein
VARATGFDSNSPANARGQSPRLHRWSRSLSEVESSSYGIDFLERSAGGLAGEQTGRKSRCH